MFDKRLLSLVPAAAKFIAADVVFQWIGLLANIALFLLVGSFMQGLVAGTAHAEAAARLAGASALAIAARLACQTLAQRMGLAASEAAKRAVRQEVYDKLVRLGPSYREHASTGEAVQISVEGVEQLESSSTRCWPRSPCSPAWRPCPCRLPWPCSRACPSSRRPSWPSRRSPSAS